MPGFFHLSSSAGRYILLFWSPHLILVVGGCACGSWGRGEGVYCPAKLCLHICIPARMPGQEEKGRGARGHMGKQSDGSRVSPGVPQAFTGHRGVAALTSQRDTWARCHPRAVTWAVWASRALLGGIKLSSLLSGRRG